MQETEKIAMVQVMLNNDSAATDDVVMTYLSLAGERILNRLYPFGTTIPEVPTQYHFAQCELATRMYLKRGAEGEVSHTENGVSRTYGSTDDDDILGRITPICKVV